MRRTAASAAEIGAQVARELQSRDIPFMAASIAYYAFVSLIPMLMLSLVAVSVLWNADVAEQVVIAVSDVLTPNATNDLIEALTEASGRGGATVASIGVLLWSTLKVFRGLNRAFSRVYGIERDGSVLEQLLDALSAFVAIGVGVGVLLVLGTALSAIVGTVARVVGQAALFLSLSVVFLPLYYVLPDLGTNVREVLPGTLIAAGGWTVLQILFSVYAGLAGGYALYGLLGAVLLVLTWLYIGSFLVLLGAVVNAVLAERSGRIEAQGDVPGRRVLAGTAREEETPDRQLQQDRGRDTSNATPMTDEREPEAAPDIAGVRDEVDRLREEIRELEQRTVEKSDLESELRRYVRWRQRRSHARGWGPYLVLLYGTGMTVGAFYYLRGGWAVLAMLVVWLSTLGLYALMVIVGAGVGAVGLAGKARDLVGRWRS